MSLPQRQVVAVRNTNDGLPLDVAMENAATATNQEQIIAKLAELGQLNALVPNGYDQVLFTYNGDDLNRVVFKAKGETLATLVLTYNNHRLTSVMRL